MTEIIVYILVMLVGLSMVIYAPKWASFDRAFRDSATKAMEKIGFPIIWFHLSKSGIVEKWISRIFGVFIFGLALWGLITSI